MSMQIRPRAEYRNGAQLPRFEGDKAASFINNRARLSMEYKRSDLSMKISAQHVYHYKLIGIGQGAAQELDKGDQHPGRLLILSHVHHALD